MKGGEARVSLAKMLVDRGETRNKRKDKKKRRKENPYRRGGFMRTINVEKK